MRRVVLQKRIAALFRLLAVTKRGKMKKVIAILLCATSAYAEDKQTIDKATAQLCLGLVSQVRLSAEDKDIVEAAKVLAAAKADLSKPVVVAKAVEPKK